MSFKSRSLLTVDFKPSLPTNTSHRTILQLLLDDDDDDDDDDDRGDDVADCDADDTDVDDDDDDYDAGCQ